MGNINFTPITDGSTADAADVNTPLQTIYDEFNGGIDNSNIAAAAAISTSKLADDAGITTAKINDGAVTSAKLAEAYARGRLQTDVNNSIANTQPTGITEQFGWGQRIGVNATVMTETVTFPVAFTTIYSLQVTFLGATDADSTAAASMVDFEATGISANAEVNNPTLSGFTVNLTQTSNFNTSRYYGFSWTAKGIV